MQRKIIRVGFAGMNQDVVDFQVNSKQAYEILNLRLNSRKNSNAMELTSEQGTKKIQCMIDGTLEDKIVSNNENIIGYCVINDYLVLFTNYDNDINRIYRLELVNGQNGQYFNVVKMYEGSLGIINEIDTIASYENENVQKVYWIDGVNQPRVINVAG